MVEAKGVMMLSKDSLRVEFSKDPKKYYSTKTFEKDGFERKQCRECKKYFWTSDAKRELCGDPSHEPYSFDNTNPKSISYVDFWKMFSKFFKENDHEIINKYPVVSRWRQDLYFTIASIQDFQRIENGKMSFEYNANPLIVPQICMRFNDIANVGLTGRHLTSFMMAGQHAFNYPKEGYWRDRTIELNYKFLTSILGVKKKDLTYIEDVWAMGDFSEYGPSLESFSNGVEIVNSVFTQFEYFDGKISELKPPVVDVGWGFERLMWFYTKAETTYDAIFPSELEYIYKNTDIKPNKKLYAKVSPYFGSLDATEVKNVTEIELSILKKAGVPIENYYDTIKPMQAAYAIADHTRTLLFALGDGALPSNVGGGYNLRVILRRVIDFMHQYKMDIDLMKLIELHAKDLKPLYSDIDESINEINEVLLVEKKRYENTKEQALKIVTQIIESKEKLTNDKARLLYESNGITPDFINSVAKSKGIKLEVPEEAYTAIMKGDFTGKHKEKKHLRINLEGLPPTEKLYYKANALESDSKIISNYLEYVVLDKTPFYPEGGGQESDTGTINDIPVKEAQNIDGIIVHILDRPIEVRKGTNAHCVINKERRLRLMAHHTATHLISAAARKVLGKHAWQEGAHKGPNKAHIDVAHYEKLTEEQVQKIEDTANSYITHGIKVSVDEMSRNDAESKFGFSIYQGHGTPASKLRIVQVKDLDGNLIDAEACGGLHLAGMESTVGLIKIISSSRIHDGINRIEFVAGSATQEHLNRLGASIDGLSKLAGIDKDKLTTGLAARLEELKLYKEKYEKAEEQISLYMAKELGSKGDKVVVKEVDSERSMLRSIATSFIETNKDKVIILSNKNGYVIALSGPDANKSALETIKEHAKAAKMDFRGGGSRRMAEGRLVKL
jgi:alanyl-tRNA synthetase